MLGQINILHEFILWILRKERILNYEAKIDRNPHIDVSNVRQIL
jgi:hypothetical protein